MKGIVFSWATVILALVIAMIFIWRPWESINTLEISPASKNIPNQTVNPSPSQGNSTIRSSDVVGLSETRQDRGNLVVSNEEQKDKVEPTLPSLAESDGYIRGLIADIPVNDLPILEWFDQEELILLFAEALAVFSAGQVPRSMRGLLQPDGKFFVNNADGKYFMNATSYRRFNKLIDRFVAISPSAVAYILKNCEPLFSQALIVIGSEKSFHNLLRDVVRDVSRTPLIYEDIELLRPKVLYTFADPVLESLSPLQKQLLRMGPSNIERIQAYMEGLFIDFGINEN